MKGNIITITVGLMFGFFIGWLEWPPKNTEPVTDPPTPWSKWSAPDDTSRLGWYREHGLVQYRTNLVTGLIEERQVR